MLRDRSLLALVSAELISRLGLHGAYLLAAALTTLAALNFVQAILASPPAVVQEAA